jgi:hypothetical protein
MILLLNNKHKLEKKIDGLNSAQIENEIEMIKE